MGLRGARACRPPKGMRIILLGRRETLSIKE